MAEIGGPNWVAVATLLAASCVGFAPSPVSAQDSERPTIEHRFGEKSNRMFLQGTVMTQIRNDFYDSVGVGADAGFYLNESLGIEARWLYLFSSLSPAASDVKERTGLTPDARPQNMMMTVGVRYSIGYGKMLIGEGALLHFDPQFVAHGGIALAEKRVLPTLKAGVSLLGHFKWGLQAKLDLLTAFQVEERRRGWVPSLGFVPMLGFGWSGSFSQIGQLFGGSDSSDAEGREQ